MRKIAIWSPLIIGIILLVLVGTFTSGFRMPNPFVTEVRFEYPQIAASRTDGGIYLIDNAFRRVLGVDSQGTVDLVVEGGNKREGFFFYANDIVTDEKNNLFVLNYVHDEYGMYLIREEIIRYDSSGRLISIPVQRFYEELIPTRVQRGEIWSIRSDGTWLYWLVLDENGIEGFRISIERLVIERLGRISYPDIHIMASDITWIDDESLILATKHGEFLELSLRTGQVSEPFYYADGFPEVVPWEIAWTDQGLSYVNLVGKEIRLLSDGASVSSSVLNTRILEAQGYPADPFYYYRLSSSSDGLLVTTNDEAVILFDPSSRVVGYKTHGTFSAGSIISKFFTWLVLLSGFYLILFAIKNFYVIVMNRKVSILLKQIFALVPLMIIAMVLITSVITRSFLDRATVQEGLTIAGLTQALTRTIDGDLVQDFKNSDGYMDSSYLILRQQLHQGINDNADPWNRSYYFALYKVIDDVLYGMMYQNDRIGMFYPFSWYDEVQGVYRLAQEGQIATEKISDVSGEWLYSVGPIYASNGEVVALLEIGTDLFNLNESNRALFNQTMRLMALISFFIILIIIGMSALILNSIRTVKQGVGQISQGNWEYQIQVRTNDEMSDLGQSFNIMSQSIGQYLQEIKKLNTSYRRFFPEQFLTYLDIPSMTDARLGDQVLKTMTVYFSDIRAFTSFSEKMTPKENFDFLNRYLNLAGPIIRKNNGFIDKYMGDAIMALFPIRSDDAVAASTQIHSALNEFNLEQKRKGLQEIAIGTGIHTGPLMLGILGEAERMQGTVISDSVNLASRLESLTKQLGAYTLISEETLASMAYPDMISTRYVGKVRVKGKQQAMKIYEVLEGIPSEIKERKIQLKPRLNNILRAYEAGNVPELEKLLANYPLSSDKEPIVGVIRFQVESWKTDGVPQPWDGTITFENK
ncbi:MAG: adenylate/guanylate cyclase domain-containing protein [Spirochaetales bacterium]|nr:adenylate/guanylate cyclase domain-containing protein [Spirochaetales bacterium]